MPSYNKVILIGNLTRDPELRYTPSGRAIAKLGLALNRSWKTETGETREEVTFVDVDAFGRQAEVLGQYLRKGRPVMVEGRLKLDQWDDKQTGQKRSRMGVVLESFQFLDSGGNRSEGGGNGGGYATTPPPANQNPAPHTQRPAPDDSMPMDDDDVPF
jgi:single-strand DNA-binding protein